MPYYNRVDETFQTVNNAPLSARAREAILSRRGGCCRDEPRCLSLTGTNLRQHRNTVEKTYVCCIFCNNNCFRVVLQPKLTLPWQHRQQCG